MSLSHTRSQQHAPKTACRSLILVIACSTIGLFALGGRRLRANGRIASFVRHAALPIQAADTIVLMQTLGGELTLN